MKDYNFSLGKTKSGDAPDQIRTRNLLVLLAKSVIVLGGIGVIVLILLEIPSYLFSPVRSINIQGNKVLSDEIIIDYLEINKKHSWISLDPYILSLNLKQNPWIEKAIVHREFPLRLDIHITERQPIAYLKTRDNLFLMAREFLVLETLPSIKVWNLPVIVNLELEQVEVGDVVEGAALKKAIDLIDILKDCIPLPLEAVSEIIVTNPFNIELITIPHGIKVKLGFQDFKKKLASLTYVLPQIEWQRKNIKYLDLRTIQGVVMKKKRS